MNDKTIQELREKVFTAIGEASMCWVPTPQGIFDSTRAEKVGKALVDEILSRAEAERGGEDICKECGGNGYVLERSGMGEEQEPTKCLECDGKGLTSTPTHDKEEPLAVLADRKGLWTFKINHYRGDKNWVIFLGVRRQDEIYDEIQFNGITYPEAEAKARAYLSSLPDKESPTTDGTKEGR